MVKGARDDPDATHGALIIREGYGQRAGCGESPGVRGGCRHGDAARPCRCRQGEPAINPVPRAMIAQAIEEEAQVLGVPADAVVEIAIPDGEAIARKTYESASWALSAVFSILGTRGIVIPFSCAAWMSFDPSRHSRCGPRRRDRPCGGRHRQHVGARHRGLE